MSVQAWEAGGMIASPSAATVIFRSDWLWRERLREAVIANLSFVLADAARDAVREVESTLKVLGVTDGRYDVFFDRMDGTVHGLLY